ncbi:hypothetical protein J0S82_004926, partial [Galemys pyrenaicus]
MCNSRDKSLTSLGTHLTDSKSSFDSHPKLWSQQTTLASFPVCSRLLKESWLLCGPKMSCLIAQVVVGGPCFYRDGGEEKQIESTVTASKGVVIGKELLKYPFCLNLKHEWWIQR